MGQRKHYEDAPEYSEDAYAVKGFEGIACQVYGWETEPVQVIGCTGCDFMGIEREHGGGYTVEPHSPECPDDAETIYSDEPEYERTGNLIIVMVGDDQKHSVDPSDVSLIPDDSFCRECGQIGCGHNVYA